MATVLEHHSCLPRIWLADTDEGLCAQARAAATEAGYGIRVFTPGVDSLPGADASLCDVVVLGMELPGKQGLERLRIFETDRLYRQVPVLVVSNRPELEYELPDAFDFLTIPLDRARFLASLHSATRIRKASVEAREPSLSPLDLSLFQNFLVTHSGLHFDQRNQKILERGLRRRMRALMISDYRDYFDYLETHYRSRQELNKLLGLLTIGETYFFRDLAQFEALRFQVLPEILHHNRNRKSLRIWSAGCSTGEEAYSLAILLQEFFPELLAWDLRILASDINHQALNKAREGAYGQRALRVTEAHLAQKYFQRRGEKFVVDESVRRLVDFQAINLQTGAYPDPSNGTDHIDILFCRNVMIYFQQETNRAVVGRFYNALRPGGYLFLGHAETLLYLSSNFERVSRERGFYYRRPVTVARQPLTGKSSAFPPDRRPKAPIAKSAGEVEADRSPRRARRREHNPAPQENCRLGSEAYDREEYQTAEKYFHRALSRDPQHCAALVGLGFICANRGEYDQALSWADRVLAVDDLDAEAYFLKGLSYELQDQWEQAREEYRKAVLVELDFIMPHFHLSRIYAKLDRMADARRELANCMRLLEKLPPETQVPRSGGMNRDVFLEVCRDNLNQFTGGQ